MSLVLRSWHLLRQQGQEKKNSSEYITTPTDASMKMKISLTLLKGDSSDELQSHPTGKPADQNTSVYYIQ